MDTEQYTENKKKIDGIFGVMDETGLTHLSSWLSTRQYNTAKTCKARDKNGNKMISLRNGHEKSGLVVIHNAQLEPHVIRIIEQNIGSGCQ